MSPDTPQQHKQPPPPRKPRDPRQRKLVILSAMAFVIILLVWIASIQARSTRDDVAASTGPAAFAKALWEPLSKGGRVIELFSETSERFGNE